MSLLRAGLCVSVAVLSTSAPAAVPSVPRLVERLVRAQRGINLRGRLTVVSTSPNSPSRTTVNRVVRRSDGSSLTVCEGPGAGRGNVSEERDGWIRSYDAPSNTITVNRSLPVPSGEGGIQRDVARILRSYRIVYAGEQDCGNRRCYRLQVSPREPMGRPVEIWMDAATGVELWRLESDRAGNTLGLTSFTSVEFPRSIPASEVRHSYPAKARRAEVSRSPMLSSLKSIRQAAGFEVYLPGYLPQGYTFERGTVVELSGRRIACLIFGDGMNTITVSQIKPTPGRARGYRHCRVVDLPLGEVMTYYTRDSLNIQVVGHLDPPALAMVAESTDPSREQGALRSMSQRFGVRLADITRLRDQGTGLDTLAALLMMRRQTGRSLASLAARLADGDDWRSLAARLHIPAALVIQKCHAMRVP